MPRPSFQKYPLWYVFHVSPCVRVIKFLHAWQLLEEMKARAAVKAERRTQAVRSLVEVKRILGTTRHAFSADQFIMFCTGLVPEASLC